MSNLFGKILFSVALTAATISFSTTAEAASLWNETINGDLSDDGLNPTALGALQVGTNSLKATFNAGTTNPSPDYFTFAVPEGLVLEEIILRSWSSSPTFEDIAFIGMQEGTLFDFVVPPDRGSAAGLLGWSHLRSTQLNTNKVLFEMSVANLSPTVSGVANFYNQEADSNPYPPDVLAQFPDLPDRLRDLTNQWAPGATGFDLPLGPGNYSIWLRQGSDVNITVKLDFNTAAVSEPESVPEPTTILGIVAALGLGVLVGKRHQQYA